jgi:predicted RNA methylase
MEARLEIWGFDQVEGKFRLQKVDLDVFNDDKTVKNHKQQFSPYFLRDFSDFQSWDRSLAKKKHPFQRISSRRFRKLMIMEWFKEDISKGWRIELQKNVSACEEWVNHAFSMLSENQRDIFVNDQRYFQAKTLHLEKINQTQTAKDLQQYFTSTHLIQMLLDRVNDILKAFQRDLTIQSKELVFLEPSCGDGRILDAFAKCCARRLIGYEIDADLHKITLEKVQKHKEQIFYGDFLQSSREQVLLEADSILVAIGNPPFSNIDRAGTNRDLILKFIRHLAFEWQAQIIAFILPERCGKLQYVEQVLNLLNQSSTSAKWSLAVQEPLDGYYFEFMGTKKITQPSILQIYMNAKANTAP